LATDSAPSTSLARPGRRLLLDLVVWIAILALVTALLVAVRLRLDKAHAVLAYLLVVLTGSAWRGRSVGLVLAILSFFCFNFFLLPPYHTLAVADPLDWLALVVYLITSLVAAQLLHRAEREADARMHLLAEAEHAQALREADRLKDALLASVSHDLRTPLTTIKALAHEIRETGDDRAATIEMEADRLNRLVADLLDLSRLNGGALALHVEPNAADDLLGSALDRLAGVPRIDTVDARIEGAEPLLGSFDFTHSLRALVNLIENALKYSPAGARVDVVVERRGDRLVFAVSDRGAGIRAEDVERVFDPFFRAAGRTPDASGAGLGLSIARRLAEAQGGAVSYQPRPGGGSVFALELPALDLPPAR
jgi:two-component system sensor histidine kinase KdpD